MFRPAVTQERLDFQLAPTRDTITGRAGLALFQEAVLVLGVRRSIEENLPAPGSGHGFKPQEYVLPLVLTLCGGGRTMEDIREIEMDEGLKQLCDFARLPGADAIGKWLKRRGQLSGLKPVNEFLARQLIVRSDKDDFTMDVDATMVETKKQCADMTYLGYRAFQALLSFIFRPGPMRGVRLSAGISAGRLRREATVAGSLPAAQVLWEAACVLTERLGRLHG